MSAPPFTQFAERIVRNDEYKQLVVAIFEAGGLPALLNLKGAIAEYRHEPAENPDTFGDRFGFPTHSEW